MSLLAHGGIAMCGGRDFDRFMLNNVIKPWLLDNFDLPDDFAADPRFKTAGADGDLGRGEGEDRAVGAGGVRHLPCPKSSWVPDDASGNEMYLDIPFSRAPFDA